ncbi:hypothetical protein HYH03_001443 [Edaphochlamys debaryana]|uniref:Ferritin n=1 Tax=Edaphochlamys debaryana TaxID=47281 RepID=A0A835YFB9_9CHLO|nr:hypothetical protein HYH03_001443 [Edaphochlamys debaryana]|eukprot:KAG2500677.1 hypothetical protein HYH03_001443 [Edaphochlamys debaryana]
MRVAPSSAARALSSRSGGPALRSPAAARPAARRPRLAVPPRAEFGGGEGEFKDPVSEKARQQVQSGLVFAPMGEVGPLVAQMDQQLMDPKSEPGLAATRSLGRSGFAPEIEAGINEQIKYVYTSMYSFFARDDVGLPGFAAYFAHNSDEERTHAHLLMRYQTQRGGRVRLLALAPPETEYWHPEKGDALHATELALSLEKLNFTKLRELHDVAQKAGDADATHFIEDYLLHEQSKDVKEAAVLVSQVRRAGLGHGVFHVDYLLSEEYGEDAAGGNGNGNGNGLGKGAGPIAG